jgi:hypothetical protein
MTYQYGKTDQHDCLYNMSRQYPGGLEALAARMDISAKLLRKKIGPADTGNQMSWEQVSLAIELCQSASVPDALQPLQAMAFRHGMICFPIPDPDTDDVSEGAIQRQAFKAIAQMGEAIAASTDAMVDGHLSEREMREIEPKIRVILPTICGWLERLRIRSKLDAGRRAIKNIMRKEAV